MQRHISQVDLMTMTVVSTSSSVKRSTAVQSMVSRSFTSQWILSDNCSLLYLAQAWFRSMTHYMFLSDHRTFRVVGEPKRSNPGVVKLSLDAGMHLDTVSPSILLLYQSTPSSASTNHHP